MMNDTRTEDCPQCQQQKSLGLCPYTGNYVCEKCMLDNEKEFIEAEKFNSMIGD